jgi:hypothetical protein
MRNPTPYPTSSSPPSQRPRKVNQLRRYLIWAMVVTGLGVGIVFHLIRTNGESGRFSPEKLQLLGIVGAMELLICLLSILGIVLVNKTQRSAKLVCCIVAIPLLISFPIGTAIGAGILISLCSREARDYLTARPDEPETFDPRAVAVGRASSSARKVLHAERRGTTHQSCPRKRGHGTQPYT